MYDIIVHVKSICSSALALGRHHIYDGIDGESISHRWLAPFRDRIDGIILSSAKQREAATSQRECQSRACVAIPHHMNLPCAHRPFAARNASVVGIIGNPLKPRPAVNALRKTLRAMLSSSTEFRDEPPPENYRPYTSRKPVYNLSDPRYCSYYGSIGLAIAWTEQTEHALGSNATSTLLAKRPAERYTNPISLGVPTVGFEGFGSFAELGGFLCSTASCVNAYLAALQQGEAGAMGRWEALQERVAAHLEAVPHLYRRIFCEVLNLRKDV